MNEIEQIPYFSINPSRICTYTRPERRKVYDKSAWQLDLKGFKKLEASSNLSDRASKRLRRALGWMLFLSDWKKVVQKSSGKKFSFKISFITLTLSSKQKHSDMDIKKQCLHNFLDIIRKRYNVSKYIWRAEAQGNGNIHFHIICDKYIPWSDVRKIWNVQQERLDYVSNFVRNQLGGGLQRDIFGGSGAKVPASAFISRKESIENILSAWSPNSTDVHAIKNIKKLYEYLCKYMAKKNDRRPIEGDLWGLSQSLSKLGNAQEVCAGLFEMEIQKIINFIGDKVYWGQYCTVIPIHGGILRKLGCWKLLKFLFDYGLKFN